MPFTELLCTALLGDFFEAVADNRDVFQAALAGNMTKTVDTERNEIVTADLLPQETAIFVVAQELGHLVSLNEIDNLLAGAGLPQDATSIARQALVSYFAAALVMPYERFHRSCVETRYDVERIARFFKASFEQVCHRMTTLQRPGLLGVPLHLVRTDIAGNISKRFSLSGIHIPRHSGRVRAGMCTRPSYILIKSIFRLAKCQRENDTCVLRNRSQRVAIPIIRLGAIFRSVWAATSCMLRRWFTPMALIFLTPS